MVEPWVSSWSKWIYGKFHHEPFQSETPEWHFSGNGPLSAANGALHGSYSNEIATGSSENSRD